MLSINKIYWIKRNIKKNDYNKLKKFIIERESHIPTNKQSKNFIKKLNN